MSRVGEVWEDQAKRVYLVLATRDDVHCAQNGTFREHVALKLSCGKLTGQTTILTEFYDYPWEEFYTRHA